MYHEAKVGCCIHMLGLLQQSTTKQMVWTTEIYSLPVLEAGSPRARCPQGWFSRGCGKDSVPSLHPGFWWCAGSLGVLSPVKASPDVCFQLHKAFSLCAPLHLNFPLTRTSVIGLRPSTPRWLHLNYICNDLTSKWGHILRYWALGLQTYEPGGTQSSP